MDTRQQRGRQRPLAQVLWVLVPLTLLAGCGESPPAKKPKAGRGGVEINTAGHSVRLNGYTVRYPESFGTPKTEIKNDKLRLVFEAHQIRLDGGVLTVDEKEHGPIPAGSTVSVDANGGVKVIPE